MKRYLVCPAVLCVAGCGQPGSPSGAVPDRYRFLAGGGIAYQDMPAIRAELPYERIEVEVFSTWTWGGPVTTLWLDGRAERTDMQGEVMKGEVRLHDYGSLCYLVDHLRFSSMEATYHWGGFDASTVTVRVWRVGDRDPVEVADTGNAGPIELWAIRAAIDGVASRIEWESAAGAQVHR